MLVFLSVVGPASECTIRSCDNGGLCVQEWNLFTCDCDMTSFTGQTCTEGKCHVMVSSQVT